MEATLAHIVPEFTSNLLAPVCLFILLFTTDWRMALAALTVVPVGMFCFAGMFAGYKENYERTINATKKSEYSDNSIRRNKSSCRGKGNGEACSNDYAA